MADDAWNNSEEVSDSPQKQHGNSNIATLRSIYENWNAAYRGFVPHGINPSGFPGSRGRYPSPSDDSPDQNTEPLPFDEDDPDFIPADSVPRVYQDIVPIPIVLMEDLSAEKPVMGSFCTFYTENVQGVSTQRIVVPQRNRSLVMLQNAGPGTVWIAQDESVGRSGFPLAAAMTAPLLIQTTREIWAIQQTAQTSNAFVSIILQYSRSLESQ